MRNFMIGTATGSIVGAFVTVLSHSDLVIGLTYIGITVATTVLLSRWSRRQRR